MQRKRNFICFLSSWFERLRWYELFLKYHFKGVAHYDTSGRQGMSGMLLENLKTTIITFLNDKSFAILGTNH